MTTPITEPMMPRMTPALAMPSPVSAPLLAAISFWAERPRTIATMPTRPTTAQQRPRIGEMMPTTRDATALALFCGAPPYDGPP